MRRQDIEVESHEDFYTGKFLIKIRAPREFGEPASFLDLHRGEMKTVLEGDLVPILELPFESQEEIIDGLLAVLSEQKKRLQERRRRDESEKDH